MTSVDGPLRAKLFAMDINESAWAAQKLANLLQALLLRLELGEVL